MSQTVLERPQAEATAQQPTQAWTKEFPPLTAQDRCDASAVKMVDGVATKKGSCGAQAFFRAILPVSGMDLLFCGHHLGAQTTGKNALGTKSEPFALREAALRAAGATIQSDYDTINLKPTDPSNAQGF